VRAIYFDKSSDANWLVPWHQDLTLALRERLESPGFGPWSVKDGIPHVQPPVELLERMLTVRIHFDDADESMAHSGFCLDRIATAGSRRTKSGGCATNRAKWSAAPALATCS
jgi:hypothetical protein